MRAQVRSRQGAMPGADGASGVQAGRGDWRLGAVARAERRAGGWGQWHGRSSAHLEGVLVAEHAPENGRRG